MVIGKDASRCKSKNFRDVASSRGRFVRLPYLARESDFLSVHDFEALDGLDELGRSEFQRTCGLPLRLW